MGPEPSERAKAKPVWARGSQNELPELPCFQLHGKWKGFFFSILLISSLPHTEIG
jgi:hypothetical protein